MSYETELFEQYGIKKIGGETSARTYTPIALASLADAVQQDNRASTSWKRAEWIFTTDPIGTRSVDDIISKWKELVKRDKADSRVQKLLLKENDGTYSMYDYRGEKLIQKAQFDAILASYLCKKLPENAPCQKIVFGAPGTGKSYGLGRAFADKEGLEKDFSLYMQQDSKLNLGSVGDYISYYRNLSNLTGCSLFDYVKKTELDALSERFAGVWDVHWTSVISKYKAFLDERLFRTVFHPDYDYAQFVGCVKPVQNGSQIEYRYNKQIFAKAYLAAWKAYLRNCENPLSVFLVIEEINRGNCAQIFGDIFQLLDRDEKGFSIYEIDPDEDLLKWLGEQNIAGLPEKLRLPPNFNILATMNTSDQSLFPMDSAFKRRFDWEYVAIDYTKVEADFNIVIGGEKYSWLHFLKKVNADIYKVTQSEDKQMGEFFVKPKDGVIDLNMFRSKVLFYLWDSVYKDEVDQKTMFHFKHPDDNGSEVTFQSLFGDDAKAIKIIRTMMDNLDKAYDSDKDGSEFKDFKILQ